MDQFDGKLTAEQKDYLIRHKVSDKKIRLIEYYLDTYKDGLTDYVDLVGEELKPGSMFFFNMKHFGHLFELDADGFSTPLIKRQAKVYVPLIKKLGPMFLHSKQVFEDRNELLAFSKVKAELERNGIARMPEQRELVFEKDKGIVLPEKPAMWTMNHHFKDDVLASVLSVQRPFYMFFGSIPQIYNTFDGVLAYLIGSIIVNRKSKDSRAAGQKKALKAISMGLDILIAPEGVWNKNPHTLIERFWPGFYRIAKEAGCKLIPIVHYIKDPTQRSPKKENRIHTVIDDPVDISYMPEKEALEYYRDILATWYYIMAEKYGQSTRAEVIGEYDNMYDAYENEMHHLMKTVDRYDIEFEKTYTYRPKNIILPQQVFEPIANIVPTKENITHKLYAQKLVEIRNREDFQGRY